MKMKTAIILRIEGIMALVLSVYFLLFHSTI